MRDASVLPALAALNHLLNQKLPEENEIILVGQFV